MPKTRAFPDGFSVIDDSRRGGSLEKPSTKDISQHQNMDQKSDEQVFINREVNSQEVTKKEVTNREAINQELDNQEIIDQEESTDQESVFLTSICEERRKELQKGPESFHQEILAYKKVANRIRPVATTLPEEFRIVRKIPSDPLANMPVLPTHPPEFTPGVRYTQERKDRMPVNKDNFLWPEEEKLVHHLIKVHEQGFAWSEEEKGKFSEEYFEPIVIPTIEHVPWVLKNIPIPRGSYDQVIKIIKDKTQAGVYEASNSSYRSRWFCVPKKDGKSLRLVHDLQPLNAVVIRDSALPPMVEQYAESFGGRACYGMFDLFVGFDQRALAPKSRDLTTFQTPLGTKRLTCIPMGYTNSVQIFHGDTTFILQDEIPTVTEPFIDDIPVKGPDSRYENEDGTYQTIPENPGIRRFVWEHLQNVNRVIQRIKHAGGTFSGLKSNICTASALVVGHRCTLEGRLPDETRVQKITDWPVCKNLTEVRGFLGTLGTIRIFIKDFAKHAKPLVQLTRKGVEFEFGEDQLLAMEILKELVRNCSAIKALDYSSDREVVLAVDSSWIAVGFILSQEGEDGKRYPSRFGSITWNETEQKYSQAKLELYGLFRALKAVKVYVVGVKNLVVEVDAKYIKGMINNPDIQPNAPINRWIAGILLFDFKLRHVSAKDHVAADGLSRRPRSPDDPEDEGDIEEWIDEAYAFSTECLNTYRKDITAKPSVDEKTGETFSIHMNNKKSHPRHDKTVLTSEILKIPRSPKAKEREEILSKIRSFLDNPVKIPGMTEPDFRKFVKKASEYFVLDKKLWKKDRLGRHKLIIDEEKRLGIIKQAHDDLGHKGVFTVRTRIGERFWWPSMDDDIKWYIKTCHECQMRLVKKISIPPTVANPHGLFRKVYIDTMLMPKAQGYRYIVHARCSLTSYPEWVMLRNENFKTIAKFIHDTLLCRWGAIEVIVTDNAPQYLQAADYLSDKHHIHHIKISPYNSKAQGPIERRHYDVREALIKAADGDESRWPEVAPSVFWAERITIQKSTGYSPFYMAHGVEPLLPFDLAEATYLAPSLDSLVSTEDLIATRAKMLQKRTQDLQRVREEVLKSRWESVRQLEKGKSKQPIDFNFKPGSLVIVRNSRFESTVSGKTKPRYFGPMIVIRRTKGGSYILGELDGTLSKLRFAAFRILPYYPRNLKAVPVTKFQDVSTEELEEKTHESGNRLDATDEEMN